MATAFGKRSADLDRQIFVLSLSLWLTHFAFMVSRDAPNREFGDLGTTAARFITALCAAGISYSLYILLKRQTPRGPLQRFFKAAIFSLPACAILTLINESAFSVLSPYYLAHPEVFLDRGEIVFTFSFFFWIFVAWAALYATLANAVELREQELRLAVAEKAASTAQLVALRLQIHPHFLFNTLNTLSGLVATGRSASAERMILDLSAFLRHTLTTSPREFVSLQDELEVQRMYLAIEAVRFMDRLRVVYAIDSECVAGLVPALILQPLVENAIKHGLGDSEEPVTITIGASRRSDVLEVWVKDERREPSPCSTTGLQIGLANVRERLAALFGDRAKLHTGQEGSGWLSRISLPWMSATQ